MRRLGAVLAIAYDRDLHDFASLLLVENLGPGTLPSLALIAGVVHGSPARFPDPARFSFALGGKDRHPFPVPLKTYDESIAVLPGRSMPPGSATGTSSTASRGSIVSCAPWRPATRRSVFDDRPKWRQLSFFDKSAGAPRTEPRPGGSGLPKC